MEEHVALPIVVTREQVARGIDRSTYPPGVRAACDRINGLLMGHQDEWPVEFGLSILGESRETRDAVEKMIRSAGWFVALNCDETGYLIW